MVTLERLGLRRPEPHEITGVASFPDQIKSLSVHAVNRALSPSIQSLQIGDFARYIYQIHEDSSRDSLQRERAGIFYVKNGSLQPAEKNYFIQSTGKRFISVEIDPPPLHPIYREKYAPKEKSVGVVMHHSNAESLPLPDNLLHLLLEDRHFKAAAAAFFLTPRGNMFALFRGPNTPQFSRRNTDYLISKFKTSHDRLEASSGLSSGIIRASLLREYVSVLDLQFFHGLVEKGILKRSNPANHILS